MNKFISVFLNLLVGIGLSGCGTSKTQLATEQLLVSDAVDRAVSEIDFRDLSGEKVYLDVDYIKTVKSIGFVNADYIISSLRQQLFAARCLVQEQKEDAEYIIEPRIGALGMDKHEVIYGLPANNLLSTAASVVPNAPAIPAIPELSLARRNDQLGAAKIAVFAYHRKTRTPIWQSGISLARSNAKDTWVFGAGPFQRGTIYDGTQFAGARLGVPLIEQEEESERRPVPIPYHSQVRFALAEGLDSTETVQAKFEEGSPAKPNKPSSAKPEKPSAERASPSPPTSQQETNSGSNSHEPTAPATELGLPWKGPGPHAHLPP